MKTCLNNYLGKPENEKLYSKANEYKLSKSNISKFSKMNAIELKTKWKCAEYDVELNLDYHRLTTTLSLGFRLNSEYYESIK